MDLLFIVRDALASSLVGTLLMARAAKKAGSEVGVLITQEALAALARGTLSWPRELAGQATRWALADRGAAAGLPLLGRGEGRQLDPKALLARAHEEGVALYACPIWSSLLGLGSELPHGLRELDEAAAVALIRKAKRVVGSL